MPRPELDEEEAPAARPDLDGEDIWWRRHDWRVEVSKEETQLGYWEWVLHQIESDGGEDASKRLPEEIALVVDPYNVNGISPELVFNSDSVQFCRLIHSIVALEKFNSEQVKQIAMHMCVDTRTAEQLLKRAAERYENIVESCSGS